MGKLTGRVGKSLTPAVPRFLVRVLSPLRVIVVQRVGAPFARKAACSRGCSNSWNYNDNDADAAEGADDTFGVRPAVGQFAPPSPLPVF